MKVIIFLSYITKHFGTTSTQWKQTESSTDVITRISAVSPSLPLLPLPADPLAHPMGASESEQRGGRVRLALSFPAGLQQTTIHSHRRATVAGAVFILALGRRAKMLKLMFQHAKKHPGVGWLILSVHLSDCYL